MSVPIEVTPEVIQEEALAVQFQPATITADFAGMRAKLEKMIEPYRGITPETAASMDIKEAKACRADLRAISKRLNDDRKAIKKVYEAPLKEFEAAIKELDALIAEPCRVIDEAIKAREEAEREGRRNALEQVYRDFMPELVELVPFDAILDPKWLNKSFGEKKAENELCEKVAGIAADWESFKKIKPQLHFPEEAEREFWRTLSLREANEADARLWEEQQRIEAFRAEVEANEAYRKEVPYEPVPQIVQEAEQQVADFSLPEFEEVRVYLFALEMTQGQRAQLVDFLRGMGVHGQPLSTGYATYKDAVMAVKEVCNG